MDEVTQLRMRRAHGYVMTLANSQGPAVNPVTLGGVAEPDNLPHRVVVVDTRLDLYRSGPARLYAYCAKPGCRWRWDGIGVLAGVRAQHEALNDEPGAA